MPLSKPTLVEASAGQPVTADAWNVIVNGLGALYDAVLAIGTGSAEVDVRAGGQPVLGAAVTAVPQSSEAGEHPVAAVPPFGTRTTYGIFGVNPGQWEIQVEAAGYQPAQQIVELPAAEPVVVNLTAAGVAMPDLFALTLPDALARIREAELGVEMILDTAGSLVPHRSVPASHADSEVLVQSPEPQAVVDPARQRVRLVVAVAAGPAPEPPAAEVPNLAGMTADEAGAALAAARLGIGSTDLLQDVAAPPQATIPNLAGLTADEAVRAVEEAGLAVGGIDELIPVR